MNINFRQYESKVLILSNHKESLLIYSLIGKAALINKVC